MTRPDGSRMERRVTNHRPHGTELPEALSVASHDVAEAVRVVSGYLELLDGHAAGALDETARRYVAGVRDGIEHLDGLLTGLLVYVRASVEPLALERVELGECLEEALRALRERLERQDARVQFGDLPAVLADGGRTRDLLCALVDNALTFASDAPPVIAVDAERDGEAWSVTVTDNGIGLPDDARERVVQPFERAHSRSLATGPGLGLAIARTIVERRGGRLTIEAAGGGGTVVRFTIPDDEPRAT